ncbi:sulfite exporter TauE/SafE family protein [Palleronia sp. LCG004]|uniref:sulfite exporter TauE/SafE family protein n=1 Tax=Palleronia sp. LCG004 TaxID=3079304 RepID=UPI002943C598|nr:sulfite exporter TauE/SafE family protein [Palleronia sp. LCG004]WOI56652.1 sulfite exporter TauE/SafE family protein [Palleronia sp. LCG004]
MVRAMHLLTDLLSPHLLAFAFAVTFAAGFVKGAVGFAMPLIMISGISVAIDPRLVVAGIILPIVFSNLLQVWRAGWAEARDALIEYRRFVLVVCSTILISAQFLTIIPAQAMYVVLGVPVIALSLVQLAGVRFRVAEEQRPRFDWGIGIVAGVLGGLAGTWGPPTILYLLALDTPKARQLAVQGVVFGLGSVALLAGHLRSGVLDGETLPFSAFLLVPAVLGMWVGFQLGDRLDQVKFRRATLIVLIVAGANLVRRGVTG